MIQIRTDAGTSAGATSAPWAAEFRIWLSSPECPWSSHAEAAAELGIQYRRFISYVAGRSFPEGPICNRLYAVSKLSCFGPQRVRSRVLHKQAKRLQSDWTKTLLVRFYDFLERISNNDKSREPLRTIACHILRSAEMARLTRTAEVTPEWLLRLNPVWKSVHSEAWGRASFGRFLVAEGIWDASAEAEFRERLKAWETLNSSTKAKEMFAAEADAKQAVRRLKKQSVNARLRAAGELIYQLAHRVGLTTSELQQLKVEMIRHGAIELGDGRKIPFGVGWHEIKKETLDTYLRLAQPRKFLFFRGGSVHGPSDFAQPAGRQTLMVALRHAKPDITIEQLRMAHYRHEFTETSNPQDFRSHLGKFHGLERTQRERLTMRFAKAPLFAVPVPYLLVALCVARLLPCEARALERGERVVCFWPKLLGRYSVEVVFTRSFSGWLKERQPNSLKTARVLWQLALELWRDRLKKQRRFGRGVRPIPVNVEVLSWLKKTKTHNPGVVMVRVRDLVNGGRWGGPIFTAPYSHQRTFFRVPLIRAMERNASKAPLAMIPLKLTENTQLLDGDALIAALLLLDAAPQPTQLAELSESSSLEKLGMPLGLSRLSAALSSLRDARVALVKDFRRTASEFLVERFEPS